MESFDPSKLTNLLGSKLDAKTKFMVLNMLDQRPINKIDKLDPVKYSFTQEKLEGMLKGELDFLICDDLFAIDTEFLQACRLEA